MTPPDLKNFDPKVLRSPNLELRDLPELSIDPADFGLADKPPLAPTPEDFVERSSPQTLRTPMSELRDFARADTTPEGLINTAVLASSIIPQTFAPRLLAAGGKLGLEAAKKLGAGKVLTKALETSGKVAVSAIAQGGTTGSVELAGQLISGTPLDESLEEAAETAIIFAVADVGGPVVATTVGKGFGMVRDAANFGRKKFRAARGKPPRMEINKIRSTTKPFGEESGFLKTGATEVINTVREVGGVPRPGSVIRHSVIDTTQQIIDTAFTSRQGQAELLRTTERLLFTNLKAVVDSMPNLGRRDVGQLLQDIVTGRLARIKGVAQANFRLGDRLAGKKMKTITKEIAEDVPFIGLGGKPILNANGTPATRTVIRTTKHEVPEFGGDILPVQKMAQGMLDTLRLGNRNNPGMEAFLERLIKKPRQQTIAAMSQMRSELFDKSNQFAAQATDILKADKAMSKALTGPMTKAMDQAMDRAPATAKAAYTEARRLWKEEVRGDLTSAYISKLANNQADDVLDGLLASASPTDIDMIRNIVMLENPSAWDAVQGEYLKRMFYKHGKRITGDADEVIGINGKAFVDDITRQAGSDGAVLKALFPDAASQGGKALTNVKRYVQASASLFEKDPAAGGAIFMQMGQAGAVGLWMMFAAQTLFDPSGAATIGTGALGAGAGYLITPHLIGRMFKNDEIVDWLIRGTKHSPGTIPALRATIAVLGFMLQDEIFTSDKEQASRASKQRESAIDLSRRLINAGKKSP